MKQRILNILIATDQWFWVFLTLGKGHPDETISAAAWRMEQQGKIAGRVFRPLVDLLFRRLRKITAIKRGFPKFSARICRVPIRGDYGR